MRFHGNLLLLFFFSFLNANDEKPLVPNRPFFILRPLKEENTIKVGRHLVIETDDGDIHLSVKVSFTINRDTRTIKVRFETQSDDEILDSIRRTYNWED